MFPWVVVPIAASLVAVGLVVAAVRGKWIVYRLLLGTMSFFVAILAGFMWLAFAVTLSEPNGGDGQPYIGWDARQLFSWRGMVWIIAMVLWVGLIVIVGNRRSRAKALHRT